MHRHRYGLRLSMVIALVTMCLPMAGRTLLADCSCGPDFCQGDPRIPGLLTSKKKSLASQGYPPRLVNLLDIGDQCVARISQSPDAFSMWLIYPNGD